MSRPTLAELERRCQKPDWQTSGNWMARRVSRPAALRVTWVIAPCGFSAHAATVAAGIVAFIAAGCFGVGTTGSCLIGALLLQLWYLLDHVDGQLARLNGTSSLDGIQLDYLMHHVVNLAVPIGLGYGVARHDGEPWLLLGFGFALGMLLLGLANDTRYKAFIARLKQLEGPLIVADRRPDAVGINGDELVPRPVYEFPLPRRRKVGQGRLGDRRPTVMCPAPARDRIPNGGPSLASSLGPPYGRETDGVEAAPGSPSSSRRAPGNQAGAIRLAVGLRSVVHVARKLCEIHVVMNVLTAIAVIQLIAIPTLPAKIYLAVMSPLALFTAIATLTRDVRRQAAEADFAAWFTAPRECSLHTAKPDSVSTYSTSLTT